MDFGSKIRGAREDRDLSQQQIAQMIPMNQSNYSKIERNLQEPNLFQLKRIIEILQLDPYKLLELDCREISKNDARQFFEGVIRLYNTFFPNENIHRDN